MANCKICGKPTNTHPWYCDECMEKYPTDKEKFELLKERQFNMKSTQTDMILDTSGIKGVFLILAIIFYCIALACLFIGIVKSEYDTFGQLIYILYCSSFLSGGLIFTIIYFISNISEKVNDISWFLERNT